jgi:predicted nucleotidyltransferase
MTNNINLQRQMIEVVARALGNNLLEQAVFVGGCTTGLLVTDDFTKEQIRYTEDVDLVVHVIGKGEWYQLQQKLRDRGFSEDMESANNVICRMLLGELKVDFMPDDPNILSFSNRWYSKVLETAERFQITEEITILLIKPEYFIATKIEAYKGRGNNDALSSHDIEDLLNLFDGRIELVDEIKTADKEVQIFISQELAKLVSDDNFEYAVQSASNNDAEREGLIFERLESCI